MILAAIGTNLWVVTKEERGCFFFKATMEKKLAIWKKANGALTEAFLITEMTRVCNINSAWGAPAIDLNSSSNNAKGFGCAK